MEEAVPLKDVRARPNSDCLELVDFLDEAWTQRTSCHKLDQGAWVSHIRTSLVVSASTGGNGNSSSSSSSHNTDRSRSTDSPLPSVDVAISEALQLGLCFADAVYTHRTAWLHHNQGSWIGALRTIARGSSGSGSSDSSHTPVEIAISRAFEQEFFVKEVGWIQRAQWREDPGLEELATRSLHAAGSRIASPSLIDPGLSEDRSGAHRILQQSNIQGPHKSGAVASGFGSGSSQSSGGDSSKRLGSGGGDSGDSRETPIDAALSKAFQQGLLVKDFLLQQLERQLCFENGCDLWLSGERSLLESRQEQAEQIGLTSRGLSFKDLHQAATKVEAMLLTRSSAWWKLEAQLLAELVEGMDDRNDPALQQGLAPIDRAAYRAFLQPLLQKIVGDFHARKRQAQSFTAERLLWVRQYVQDLVDDRFAMEFRRFRMPAEITASPRQGALPLHPRLERAGSEDGSDSTAPASGEEVDHDDEGEGNVSNGSNGSNSSNGSNGSSRSSNQQPGLGWEAAGSGPSRPGSSEESRTSDLPEPAAVEYDLDNFHFEEEIDGVGSGLSSEFSGVSSASRSTHATIPSQAASAHAETDQEENGVRAPPG